MSVIGTTMSRIEKLIALIRKRPVEAEFDDVATVLEHFGWKAARTKGSHVSFTKAGEAPIVIPKKHGRKVKRVYLDDLSGRLGLDDD